MAKTEKEWSNHKKEVVENAKKELAKHERHGDVRKIENAKAYLKSVTEMPDRW